MDLILTNAFDHGRNESGFWPNDSQALLTRIILGLEADVPSSYSDWKENIDFDNIGQATLRLLPMLLPTLSELPINAEERTFLGNIRKQTWWHNQKLLQSLDSVRTSLDSCSVKFIPLKGVALIIDQSYAEAADRYTSDIDILIQPQDLKAAVAQLEKDGWTICDQPDSADIDPTAILRHALEFTRGDEENLDLHWSLFHRYGQLDNQNDSQWQNAVSIDFRTSRFLLLNPTDQLLHTCAHGARWAHYVAPIRWLVDAYRIIVTHETEIDWDRLVFEARQQQLVIPVRDTLHYLHDHLQLAIPKPTLEALCHSRVTWFERITHYFTSRPYMRNFYPQRLIRTWRFSMVEHRGFRKKYDNMGLYIRHLFSISSEENVLEALMSKTKRLFARLATNR